MIVDFLQAADNTPLTKHYVRKTDGSLDETPYPHVRDFFSHREEIDSIESFAAALQAHAKRHHCVLKGQLDRELVNESRAGHTSATDGTRWVLLDLDFHDGWDSVDSFLYDLAPEWADVSYIWQYSASAGVKKELGLRGHIFLMLDGEVTPDALKGWLKERNLFTPKLVERMELTKTAMGIKWPLDITTCQNDKLIYIAPPLLQGLEDPADQRIQLVRKTKDLAPVPKQERGIHELQTAERDQLNTLRRAAGLRNREAKYQTDGDIVVLTNPDPVEVTGVRQARGFVYLNLNHGDSWAYFFPEDNPTILHNFKGEPAVRLRDVAPNFYTEFRRNQLQQRFGDIRPYVFRDPETDTYYNVLWNKEEKQIKMMRPVSSKERMRDFMEQYGHGLPEPIEDWTVVFDPTTNQTFNPDAQWVNWFRPSEYLLHAPKLTAYPEVPPIIDRILESICVNDQQIKEHFLNWLACLVQSRKKLMTGWVFHGVQGTGKGALFSEVLRPILGHDNATSWGTKEFDDGFNEKLQRTSLLWLDEFKAGSARNVDAMMSKLKHLVTEPTLAIRAMRTDTYEKSSYTNVIIASNFPDPIQLEENDRRWNVAPAQERRLTLSTKQVEQLREEVWLFASYLMHRKADFDKAKTVLHNHAREEMIGASMSSTERFFAALRKGELDWFAAELQPDKKLVTDVIQYQKYERAVLSWINDRLVRQDDQPMYITKDELNGVFNYLTGQNPHSAKFGRMCKIYRVHFTKCQFADRDIPAGLATPIHWQTQNLEWLKEARAAVANEADHKPKARIATKR